MNELTEPKEAQKSGEVPGRLEQIVIRFKYENACKWREEWLTIANNQEYGRLQFKQDKIERRISIASNRISNLMKEFDRYCV